MPIFQYTGDLEGGGMYSGVVLGIEVMLLKRYRILAAQCRTIGCSSSSGHSKKSNPFFQVSEPHSGGHVGRRVSAIGYRTQQYRNDSDG